jgi:hypothetical protein
MRIVCTIYVASLQYLDYLRNSKNLRRMERNLAVYT